MSYPAFICWFICLFVNRITAHRKLQADLAEICMEDYTWPNIEVLSFWW